MTTPHRISLHDHHGPLFRVIAFVNRWRLNNLLRSAHNPRLAVVVFAVAAGALSLSTITVAAMITSLPLLFPPLAPSAFILFVTPMTPQASPRSVVLAHTFAIMVGIAALQLVAQLFPQAGLMDPAVLNGPRVLAIALAMGGITVMMTLLRCSHPPAAATALIAALGYLAEPTQALGLAVAACLLALEAILLNRLVGGLPYPLWRPNPRAAHGYGLLAGSTEGHGNYWQQLSEQLLRNREAGRK